MDREEGLERATCVKIRCPSSPTTIPLPLPPRKSPLASTQPARWWCQGGHGPRRR
jgi:hypothetical protein